MLARLAHVQGIPHSLVLLLLLYTYTIISKSILAILGYFLWGFTWAFAHFTVYVFQWNTGTPVHCTQVLTVSGQILRTGTHRRLYHVSWVKGGHSKSHLDRTHYRRHGICFPSYGQVSIIQLGGLEQCELARAWTNHSWHERDWLMFYNATCTRTTTADG